MSNGTRLKVYNADITSVPVEVIVNAANEELDHIGGVAYAISKAAGDKFQEESHTYVANNGNIPTSQVAVTGAGNLKYKSVIHAVGPMWRGESTRKVFNHVII